MHCSCWLNSLRDTGLTHMKFRTFWLVFLCLFSLHSALFFFGRTQIKRNKQQFSTFQCFLKATNLNIARRGLCSPGCKRKHQLLRYIYRWPAPNEGWIHRKTVWKPASALIKQELERLSGISNSEREVSGTPFRSNLKRLGDTALLTVSKVKSANLRPMGKD